MSQSRIDPSVTLGLRVVAAVSLLIVAMIGVFLAVESFPAIQQLGFRMVTDSSWDPSRPPDLASFGLVPIVVGTVLVTFGAVLIAAPMGVISAVFSQFYAPPAVAIAYRRLVELLAGIPSVVFGFWSIVVLAPRVAQFAEWAGCGQILGASLLTAVLIVALMILPTVMLISEAALAAVRRDYILSAASLGMSRFSIVWRIVLPQAKTGIVTAIVLAAARAIGETMAVVMAAGNVPRIPESIFDPVLTLTAAIALEMGYAVELHRSVLFVAGLLLLLTVSALFAVEIVLRRIIWRSKS